MSHSVLNLRESVKDRQYCKSAFSRICEQEKLNKVHLFFIVLFNRNLNGFSGRISLFGHPFDFVGINLFPLHGKESASEGLHQFFMYATVAHELEHIRMLQVEECAQELPYQIAAWQLARQNFLLLRKLLRNLLYQRSPDYLRKIKYAVSIQEIICFRKGILSAQKQLEDSLSSEDRGTVEILAEGVEFVYQHLEIDYYNSRQAYNLFIFTLKDISRVMRKRPNLTAKLPLANLLCLESGKLISPLALYKKRTAENAGLIDDMLVRLFIALELDWNILFSQSEQFASHMEELANQYCGKAVDYLSRMQLGEVFLSKDILQDNAAMYIKNAERLNTLMKRYGMKRTAGGPVPLYYLNGNQRKPNPR